MPDVQNASDAPSSEHWNKVFGSLASNVKVAVVASVATGGPDRIVTVGGVRSPLSQANSAGVRSMAVPSGLTARTCSSCAPYGTSVKVAGEVQAANGARSSEHSKVAPAWSDEKVKLADVLSICAAGPVRIEVF